MTSNIRYHVIHVLIGGFILLTSSRGTNCDVTVLPEVTITKDEVTVGVQGFGELLLHNDDNPMLYVGRGETSFSEYRGNFKIDDYVNERIGLRHFAARTEAGDVVITFTDGLDAHVEVKFGPVEGHQLAMTFTSFPEGYDRLWLRLPAEKDEFIYGGGEQFSSFNLRGKKYPIWTREQGVGRDKKYILTSLADLMEGGAGGDYHTTYFPQPTFLSSRHYYCHLTSSLYAHLDFSHDDFHEIFVLGNPGTLYFGAGESLKDLVAQLSGFLGRQPPLPSWVNDGVILGTQEGTERMLEMVNRAEESGVRVSGVWIQDWSGRLVTSFGERVLWEWRWDPMRYPGLDEEIKKLEQRGVKVLVYINPHLHSEGSLFQEADELGYLMKNTQSQTYVQDFGEYNCGSVDFTNPAAFEWYKEKIIKTNVLGLGIRGWMADFSEYIPEDAVFYNGQTGATIHNLYPVLWARVNHEAVEEAGLLGEVVYFMRAGGSGTSGHSVLMWAGDQNVDWSMSDGLASTLPAALSLGVSGVGLTHYDIGGYTTVVRTASLPGLTVSVNMTRSKELFFRGAEAAVFTAAMRTHEGNKPLSNFQVYNDVEDMKKFAVHVNMFRALKPYTQAAIQQYYDTGIPLQRPLFLQYENDPNCFSQEYQYMFGDDILVAPVFSPGISQWSVYLPDDDWLYFYDDTLYTGPLEVVVPAPLGRVPVFYRNSTKWADLFRNVAKLATESEVCTNGTCED